MRRARAGGFTLLEVLVALAILGVSLTALLRVFTSVTGSARIGDDYRTALQIAETQLALRTALEDPRGRDRGDVNDYFRWQLEVAEYEPGPGARVLPQPDFARPLTPWVPYHYQVTVTWGAGRERELALSTIRLGVRP